MFGLRVLPSVLCTIALLGRDLLGDTRWIATQMFNRFDAARAGFDAGYERGYQDGRRIARPVLIPGGLHDDIYDTDPPRHRVS